MSPRSLRTRGSRVRIAFASLAIALAAACSTPVERELRSVIVVSLDTTRADRIGAYGGSAVPTPNLDRIAHEGALFEEALSTAPLTLPAHASLFTGRYPAAHGARHNGLYRLRDSELTLAERLRAAGFATAAFVGAFVVNRGFGLEQGFDLYDDVDAGASPGDPINDAERTADAVNRRVFSWIDTAPEDPFLLWVHYYDPHDPYDPPEVPGRRLEGVGYDREISYVDACLGELLDRLEARGLLDRSILVVVGDHGESLGEHREETHGVFLYESAMRVPLLVRAPGLIPAGRRVSGPVSIVDVMPTVIDLLGLDPTEAGEGRSLLGHIAGDAGRDDAVVFAESMMPRLEFGWSELRMARDARFKYIQAPREELYDLREDPGELHNLAGVDPQRTRTMAGWVDDWERGTRDDGAGDAERELAETELERLQSLGYLGGGSIDRDTTAGSIAVDPKDAIGTSILLQDARERIEEGDREGAVPMLEQVLAEIPANPLAASLLIKTLVELDRPADAAAVAASTLETARSSGSASPSFLRQLRLRLAAVYHLQGRDDVAESTYREALEGWVADDSSTALVGLTSAVGTEIARRVFEDLLEKDPAHPVALAGLMEFALDADDRGAATAVARRIVAGDAAPSVPGRFLSEGGMLLLDAGEAPAAIVLLRGAIEKMGPQPDLLGYLGTALIATGQLDEAETALLEVRRLRPADPRSHFHLGNIALLRDREADARAHYAAALGHDPDWTVPLHALASWLAMKGRAAEAAEVLDEALRRNPNDATARALLRDLGRNPADVGR